MATPGCDDRLAIMAKPAAIKDLLKSACNICLSGFPSGVLDRRVNLCLRISMGERARLELLLLLVLVRARIRRRAAQAVAAATGPDAVDVLRHALVDVAGRCASTVSPSRVEQHCRDR